LAESVSPMKMNTSGMETLRTAQIGSCGEFLVQYRLLKQGIESAPMTTDSGVDLIVYAPSKDGAMTVQVKANQRPKPAGGKGQLALDWRLDDDSPTQLVALVDLQKDRVWLFRHRELAHHAQQHANGRMHFYLYVDPAYEPKKKGTHVREFADFEIDRRIEELFGVTIG
jgi:hypothetical protein